MDTTEIMISRVNVPVEADFTSLNDAVLWTMRRLRTDPHEPPRDEATTDHICELIGIGLRVLLFLCSKNATCSPALARRGGAAPPVAAPHPPPRWSRPAGGWGTHSPAPGPLRHRPSNRRRRGHGPAAAATRAWLAYQNRLSQSGRTVPEIRFIAPYWVRIGATTAEPAKRVIPVTAPRRR